MAALPNDGVPAVSLVFADEVAPVWLSESGAHAFVELLRDVAARGGEVEFAVDATKTNGESCVVRVTALADWVRAYTSNIESGLSAQIARREGKPVGKICRITRTEDEEISGIETRYQY